MKPVVLAVTLAFFATSHKAVSHEFWIDPLDFDVAVGEPVIAHLRVGEDFVGSSMSYLPRNFELFTVASGGDTLPVEGRLGDIPAANIEGLSNGLAVIAHQTGVNRLTWDEWERFLGFANHKDLGDVTEMHAERGLSLENVREDYVRYAKSMIAVGDGEGSDARVGMRAELVALTNPYGSEFGGNMVVELWYDGALQADTQVEVFAADADGNVEITLARTNSDGIAEIPVQAGLRYMFDSVFLEAVESEVDGDAIWVTHWANLTFAVPQ